MPAAPVFLCFASAGLDELTDRVANEGSEPNSVAQHGSLVYVLNTAGNQSARCEAFREEAADTMDASWCTPVIASPRTRP
jgi:hypothetical protein